MSNTTGNSLSKCKTIYSVEKNLILNLKIVVLYILNSASVNKTFPRIFLYLVLLMPTFPEV